MKVTNIHTRTIPSPKEKVAELFGTLASKNDQIWPIDKWPRMKFKEGLKVGATGGHGPIRYSVEQYIPGAFIRFKFSQPKGFDGFHQFEIKDLDKHTTVIKHTIDMQTSGKGSLAWVLVIRWLHDALIEDAFDKIENHFTTEKKETQWNIWVKLLRYLAKPKKK
ncbi:MAG: hypothetical protein DHS20C18_12160 [Saprospiraceae bacterium]|nr:MAG: hypothetical protein DHS20C18_12160 [Saprospiraceae bacterium]